jgi:hypothetical protein
MEIVGERDKHLGPKWDFARAVVAVEPSESFEVVDITGDAVALSSGYIESFLDGLFDEILTQEPGPILRIKIVLKAIEHDPVDSSRNAFVEAGRDAGRKLWAWLGD